MLFQYNIFPETRDAMAQAGLRLHALAKWQDIRERMIVLPQPSVT
ncbi:hypothetical protein [Celeribacter naphthalenivorans]|nr:hypothetical protein [Celeribacter naphthalenivorans]